MNSTYLVCEKCLKTNRIPVDRITAGPVCGQCKAAFSIHQGVSDISAQALQKLLKNSALPVVVDFWAPWCGPCRAFAPTYQQAAGQLLGRAVLVKLNTEEHPQASQAYSIRGIPTLAVFREGRELGRQSGAMPLPTFLQWLSPYLGSGSQQAAG